MGESEEYRVNLILTDHLVKEGKARAIREGTSLSAVVRGLLAWWLDERLPTPTKEPIQLAFLAETISMPDLITDELAGRLQTMQKQIDELRHVIDVLRLKVRDGELVGAGRE